MQTARSTREDLAKNAIEVWNGIVGKDSKLTIGPRRLDFGTNLEGTVLNPGERRFISMPIQDDQVKLSFKKTGGQSETHVVISKLDANGKCSEVAHYTVPFGKGSFHKTITVPSTQGAILIVRVTPTVPLRKLDYTLRADGKVSPPDTEPPLPTYSRSSSSESINSSISANHAPILTDEAQTARHARRSQTHHSILHPHPRGLRCDGLHRQPCAGRRFLQVR